VYVPPREDLRARAVETDLEQIVENDSADRRGNEEHGRVLVLVEPEEHAGDEHEHSHHDAGPER
jgi:hypothetical protein